MNRVRAIALIIGLVAAAGAFAQVAADPLDHFYDDLVIWETMGLVGNLPAARPYPLQMVEIILKQVIERGDEYQKHLAELHYNRIFKKTLSVGTKAELAFDTLKGFKQMGLALSADLNYMFNPLVGASFSLDGWAINKLPDEELIPLRTGSTKDIVADNAKVGPFYVLPSVNSSVSFGNGEYYLNAGLMRGSYGPFHSNGVIVGPQALHAGQFDFAVNKKLWGFDMSLYALSAGDGYGETYVSKHSDAYEGLTVPRSEAWYPEKYLVVHSFSVHPYEWLSISLLESVMYGGRFDPMYLLPFSVYNMTQPLNGFRDNCYLGGMFTVKPLEGMKIDGVLYADDLSFNDIIKLQFDTKWRLAGQLGVSYAPRRSGLFTYVSLDYTMVTPYTYSHRNDGDVDLSEPNYQNYTHAGRPFGADLDPNSDRLNLRVKLRPLEAVDVNVFGAMIRHANVNQGMTDDQIEQYVKTPNSYITDGTIMNNSFVDGAGHAFNYSTPFLSQGLKQYIWQIGVEALCRLPILKTHGYVVFRIGYTFEANFNKGVNERIYHYETGAEALSREDALTLGRAQLAAWEQQATGVEYNNYISAGFEYHY
jgi:hypothetical protein